jgi:cytochrome c553
MSLQPRFDHRVNKVVTVKIDKSHAKLPGLVLILCMIMGMQKGTFADEAGDTLVRGQDVFETNCAGCHGPAGYPDPDSSLVKSLGLRPANFSDPLFNSR